MAKNLAKNAGKSRDCKENMSCEAGENATDLFGKLRNMRRKRLSTPVSKKDFEIPPDAFDKSLRELDAACTSFAGAKEKQDKIVPHPNLGFVPFSSLIEVPETRKSTTFLSLDEENDEEDLFADAENPEEPKMNCSGDSDNSDTWFHGFSREARLLSQENAQRFSQHSGSDYCTEFPGFTSKEIDRSVLEAQKYQLSLERCNVEPFSSLTKHSDTSMVNEKSNSVVHEENIGKLKVDMNFTNARGDNKRLSEEAIARAKKQLEEEDPILNDFETNSDFQFPERNVNLGFSNVAGRESKVSEKILDGSRVQYEQIIDELEKNSPVCEKVGNNKQNCTFVRGCSDGKKNLDGSEKVLSGTIKRNETITNSKLSGGNGNAGFSTAGGRKLKISDDIIAKAQAQYEQIRDEIKDNSEKQLDHTGDFKTISSFRVPNSNLNVGFATAGGRRLKFSEEILAKARAQYEQITDEIGEKSEINEKIVDKCTKVSKETEKKVFPKDLNEKSRPIGFMTGRGGKLRVSEKKLSEARVNYEAIVIDEKATKKYPSNDEKKRNLDCVDELKEKSDDREKLRKDDEFDEFGGDRKSTKFIPTSSNVQLPQRNSNVGFAAASGRQLKISEEILAKARAQYEQITDEVQENSVKNEKITPIFPNVLKATEKKVFPKDLYKNNSPIGFVTGRGGKCKVSEKKLAEARANYESLEKESIEKIGSIDKKRKFDCIDEDTPTRQGPDSWNYNKKRHITADIQGRKLFENDPEIGQISEEIDASAAALLEDEKLSAAAAAAAAANKKDADSHFDIPLESIPDDLNFETQFSQDPQDTSQLNKLFMESMIIIEGRLTATGKQEEVIRTKRRSKIRHEDGSLYRLRNSNPKISWRDFLGDDATSPTQYSNDAVSTIDSVSAATYTFSFPDFYGEDDVKSNIEGIRVGDTAFVILDEKNNAGVREFERAFLASPGIDPNLVPTGWVKNHYRWIVWKLASIDRSQFGRRRLPRMLTPDRVMLELKYRYDREIYRCQWPPLRRILEKNHDSSLRLVLCVANISTQEDDKVMYKMVLTDGWYSIVASTDIAMIKCIRSGKIKEGTKIATFGAKVTNLDQGCSALEIPDSVTLRIHTNSTRRVKWDTKLDFYRPACGPMPVSLKSVKSSGGTIGKMIVAVARLYPMLYREKLADGEFVFRNARCDEEAARAHEARYQSKIEEIYANAWTDFQMNSQTSESQEADIREKIGSKLRECLPPPRDVTPVMKIRIADGDASAIMTIWSADREMSQTFVEGSSLVIYNAFAAGHVCSDLQITANRSTFIKASPSRPIVHPTREFTAIAEVAKPGFNPIYGEFDTVGIVVSVGPAPHGMKNFEAVNLAFPRDIDSEADDDSQIEASDFLSILFWQGVATHGYSKVLTVGTLIACSNVEWRRNTSYRPNIVPTAYSNERTLFSKYPPKKLVEPFQQLQDRIKDKVAYAATSAARIREEIAKKRCVNGTPGTGGATTWTTPYKCNNSSTPDRSSVSSTPENHSRKASIMRRIEKLGAYGEAPKLPAIFLGQPSPSVSAEYRSPIPSKTPEH